MPIGVISAKITLIYNCETESESSLLMRKQHIIYIKCVPAAERLGSRISMTMASQPCGGTIANTVRVFTPRKNDVHNNYWDRL